MSGGVTACSPIPGCVRGGVTACSPISRCVGGGDCLQPHPQVQGGTRSPAFSACTRALYSFIFYLFHVELSKTVAWGPGHPVRTSMQTLQIRSHPHPAVPLPASRDRDTNSGLPCSLSPHWTIILGHASSLAPAPFSSSSWSHFSPPSTITWPCSPGPLKKLGEGPQTVPQPFGLGPPQQGAAAGGQHSLS